MTLRDLTPRQLYNLRRRATKERRLWKKRRLEFKEYSSLQTNHFADITWEAAYNAGLKAGLEFAK